MTLLASGALLACGSPDLLLGQILEAGPETNVSAVPPAEAGDDAPDGGDASTGGGIDATAKEAGSVAPDGTLSDAGDATLEARPTDADASPETGTPCSEPTSAVSGAAYWAQSLYGGNVYVNDVALDGQGNVLAVGSARGSATIGGTTLPGTPGADGSTPPGEAYVAKLDPAGNLVFAERFTASCASCFYVDQSAFGVAVDAAGNIYVVGGFQEKMTIPGNPPRILDTGHVETTNNNGGAEWAFLAKLDPAGQHVWSKTFGAGPDGPTGAQAWRVAVDPQGDIVISGTYAGPVDFAGTGDGGPGSFDLPGSGGFVAKFTSEGAPVWSRALITDLAYVADMATDPSGSVYVAGSFSRTLGFAGAGLDGGDADGGAPGSCYPEAGPFPCFETAFAVKVLSDGTLAWRDVLESQGRSSSQGVSVDGLGNPVVIGWAHDIAFDDAGTPQDTNGRGVITKLDPASGAPQWNLAVGPGGTYAGVACDSVGNVFVVTQSAGHTTFSDGYDAGGGGTGSDGVVARVSPDGHTTWARSLGGGTFQGVAVERCAEEIVAYGLLFGPAYPAFTLENAGDGGAFSFDASATPGVLARLAR